MCFWDVELYALHTKCTDDLVEITHEHRRDGTSRELSVSAPALVFLSVFLIKQVKLQFLPLV